MSARKLGVILSVTDVVLARKLGVITAVTDIMSADEQVVLTLSKYTAAYLAINHLVFLTFGVVARAQISTAVSTVCVRSVFTAPVTAFKQSVLAAQTDEMSAARGVVLTGLTSVVSAVELGVIHTVTSVMSATKL